MRTCLQPPVPGTHLARSGGLQPGWSLSSSWASSARGWLGDQQIRREALKTGSFDSAISSRLVWLRPAGRGHGRVQGDAARRSVHSAYWSAQPWSTGYPQCRLRRRTPVAVQHRCAGEGHTRSENTQERDHWVHRQGRGVPWPDPPGKCIQIHRPNGGGAERYVRQPTRRCRGQGAAETADLLLQFGVRGTWLTGAALILTWVWLRSGGRLLRCGWPEVRYQPSPLGLALLPCSSFLSSEPMHVGATRAIDVLLGKMRDGDRAGHWLSSARATGASYVRADGGDRDEASRPRGRSRIAAARLDAEAPAEAALPHIQDCNAGR